VLQTVLVISPAQNPVGFVLDINDEQHSHLRTYAYYAIEKELETKTLLTYKQHYSNTWTLL